MLVIPPFVLRFSTPFFWTILSPSFSSRHCETAPSVPLGRIFHLVSQYRAGVHSFAEPIAAKSLAAFAVGFFHFLGVNRHPQVIVRFHRRLVQLCAPDFLIVNGTSSLVQAPVIAFTPFSRPVAQVHSPRSVFSNFRSVFSHFTWYPTSLLHLVSLPVARFFPQFAILRIVCMRSRGIQPSCGTKSTGSFGSRPQRNIVPELVNNRGFFFPSSSLLSSSTVRDR